MPKQNVVTLDAPRTQHFQQNKISPTRIVTKGLHLDPHGEPLSHNTPYRSLTHRKTTKNFPKNFLQKILKLTLTLFAANATHLIPYQRNHSQLTPNTIQKAYSQPIPNTILILL